ncbi:MAG: HD domain-containing protein [Spirochaetales bacterium]|nr:HD domain-containing protein [Spirochaetales bacterium]
MSRRDFTINALAWDLQNSCLKDNFDGKGDLNRKVIRAIGNPDERFSEDALRMLRACRFAAKLEFTIDEQTLASMTRLSHLIQNISEERIRDEFIKMMGSPRPSVGIEYMRVSGLLDFILPELMKGYGVVQNRFHRYDVYYHNVYSCDAAPADNYIVRIAALFHDIAKPQTKRAKADEPENENENSFYNHDIVGERIAKHILRRLKFTNEDTKKIRHLIKNHMFYYTDDWTDGAVRRFLRKVGVENLPDLFALREADRLGNGTKAGIPKAFIDFQDRIKHILEVDAALKVSDLDINGNDIMTTLNLTPGPIIGEILSYLLELVLDNPEINTHETLMERAAEYYNKKKDYCLEQYGKPPEQLGRF